MQTKIENGYRTFETIKNAPASFSIGSGEVIDGFKEKSPFANFFVELKNSHYVECQNMEETDKQQCMYELRQKLKSLAIEFVVSYLPNFPDQLGECLQK